MHCTRCNGFVTPNVSTCTCDPTPKLETRLDQHFLFIQYLNGAIEKLEGMLREQRNTIASLALRLDQFQEIENRQDDELTAIRSEVADLQGAISFTA